MKLSGIIVVLVFLAASCQKDTIRPVNDNAENNIRIDRTSTPNTPAPGPAGLSSSGSDNTGTSGTLTNSDDPGIVDPNSDTDASKPRPKKGK